MESRPNSTTLAAMRPVKDVDVVVIGAGIIGLLCTRQLLNQGLKVALVERKELCAGATGAGQGYIWMAHRSPGTPGWRLASDSISIWRDVLMKNEGLARGCEWQETGSLLLATNQDEVESLMKRREALASGGVASQILTAKQVGEMEPAIMLPEGGGGAGLLVPQDSQINGRGAAATLLALVKQSPNLHFQLNDPVTRLHEEGDGAVVETLSTVLGASRGVIVAAGVWSGEILSQSLGNDKWKGLLQPRRGHLIEIDRPKGMPILHRGVMEVKYSKHYSQESSSSSSAGNEVDITFTATQSASGSLLVGSSREFSGWEAMPSSEIIQAIMARASTFLPHLQGVKVDPSDGSVRVGLRPYCLGGLPMIGLVSKRLVVAAGHEGSGLALGPATASLAVDALISGSNEHIAEDFLPSTRLIST